MEIGTSKNSPDFGGLVFSIDFELHWGVRDLQPANGNYRENLLGERKAVPEMLKIFNEFGIAATWATVGFLFAQTREELKSFSPVLKPLYEDPSLSPYEESIGADEASDPLHYAPTLIREIQKYPSQEIGTHTFSHYYCLENGQSKETFHADLQSAKKIARQYGVSLSSIVFPRNQVNPEYFDVLLKEEIICCRGNEASWIYLCHEKPGAAHPPSARLGRLADSYLNLTGNHLTAWSQIVKSSGMCDIPSSRFIRPRNETLGALETRRLKRIIDALREAAATRKVIHLWTHAHNLGVNMKENLAFLRAIGEEFRRLHNQYGMRSLTMRDAALLAKGEA